MLYTPLVGFQAYAVICWFVYVLSEQGALKAVKPGTKKQPENFSGCFFALSGC